MFSIRREFQADTRDSAVLQMQSASQKYIFKVTEHTQHLNIFSSFFSSISSCTISACAPNLSLSPTTRSGKSCTARNNKVLSVAIPVFTPPCIPILPIPAGGRRGIQPSPISEQQTKNIWQALQIFEISVAFALIIPFSPPAIYNRLFGISYHMSWTFWFSGFNAYSFNFWAFASNSVLFAVTSFEVHANQNRTFSALIGQFQKRLTVGQVSTFLQKETCFCGWLYNVYNINFENCPCQAGR